MITVYVTAEDLEGQVMNPGYRQFPSLEMWLFDSGYLSASK